MIQVRIDISARVTPRAFSCLNARRANAWPKKLTLTVTKDNSMSFAKSDVKKAAVDGVSRPPEFRTALPHCGARAAMTKYMAEKAVEKTTKIIMVTETQLESLPCLTFFALAQLCAAAKSS
jgi:hypothetical protein